MDNSLINQIIKSSNLKHDIIQNLKASREFNFLDAGNDRVVAKPTTQSVVYKIENNPDQNVREFDFYNSDNRTIQDKLLEIKDKSDDYKWIKCPVSNFSVSEEDKIQFMNLLINKHGLIPRDFSPKDIARVNRNILITDYGHGFREQKEPISELSDIER